MHIREHQDCILSKKQAYTDCTTFIFKMKRFVYGTDYNDEVKEHCLGYIKFETIDMHYSYLKSLFLHRKEAKIDCKEISSNQHTNENTEEQKPSKDDELKLPKVTEIESSEDYEIKHLENGELKIPTNDDEDDELNSSDDENELKLPDGKLKHSDDENELKLPDGKLKSSEDEERKSSETEVTPSEKAASMFLIKISLILLAILLVTC